MKTRIVLALGAFFLATVSSAQEGEVSWKSTEVAPGLYMLESQNGFAGGNLSLITGDDGVVLIDDGLEPLTSMTVATVEALTGDPVDFVI
ncbi:MAG: MBL fold metallo-hydrolase, partial [Woeseiaceae bacterium]|nr:MBL fold metallo-hydrolase [Woeseiaceae bacterium]